MADSIYNPENWTKVELVAPHLPERFRNQPDSVDSIEVQDMSGHGGNSGEMSRIIITEKDTKAKTSYILKTTKPSDSSASSSQKLGLYREAIFYKKCLPLFGAQSVPEIHSSEWSTESGRKAILMEDLATRGAVQAGYFFGDNSILNKGKDLAAITAGYKGLTELQLSKMAFSVAAKLHGAFWGVPQEGILSAEYGFLKGQMWLSGGGKESWLETKEHAAGCWRQTLGKKTEEDGKTLYGKVCYDQVLLDFMQSTLIDSTFEEYTVAVKEQGVVPTFAHGDFHPANFMVVAGSGESQQPELKVLDFEVVGIGSGPQDLGQFMISHPSPASRRAHEVELLRHYHTELLEVLKEHNSTATPPTFEDIQKEYVLGGMGRWAWLLGVCSAMVPPAFNQYFQDQMVAFLQDHRHIVEKVKIFPRP